MENGNPYIFGIATCPFICFHSSNYLLKNNSKEGNLRIFKASQMIDFKDLREQSKLMEAAYMKSG